jgi:hypothetical protein
MRACPLFLLLLACNPKAGLDTDTACDEDAEVSAENGTEGTINRLWVCTPESCTSWLDGIGTDPGETWRTDACAAPELVLAVVDLDRGCAVSDSFSLEAEGSHVWVVDAMTGTWPDENTFGCVAN